MIVLDASAAIEWLLQTPTGQKIDRRIYSRNESLHCPHVMDLEVTQGLRRLARENLIPGRRAQEAVQDLVDLRITRYPHFIFLPKIWQARHNFSAYDAVYVALAQELEATLVTRDARLAEAASKMADVEVY